MSNNSENLKKMFTFIWKIENFSMCSQQSNESFTSPVFTSKMIKNVEFLLRLYPKGDENEKNMSCFLERVDNKLHAITISFDILLDCQNSASNVKQSSVSRKFDDNNRCWPSQKLISFEEIIEDFTYGFLEDDVLTLKCCMWLMDSDQLPVDDDTIFQCFQLVDVCNNDDNSVKVRRTEISSDFEEPGNKVLHKKFCSYPNEIVARSRISTERKSIQWSIPDFTSCPSNQKQFVPLLSQSKRDPPLLIVLNFHSEMIEDEFAKIEIQKVKRALEQPFFLQCQITVVADGIDSNVTKEASHFFKSDENMWNFPPIIKKHMTNIDQIVYLPNNVLTLNCVFSISTGIINSWIEEIRNTTVEYQNIILMKDSPNGNMKTDFNHLYKEKTLCDVVLKIEKQSIKAHKAVLLARSGVFKAMFESNMKESRTNTIPINDMEVETLQLMLKFMYTDTLEKLDIDRAAKLYAAAEKYQLLKLKKKCSDSIKANLTLSNVYDIIVLLDLYDDQELESMALNLLCVNKSTVLNSEEWAEFMKSWPRLARVILYKICLKLPDI